MVTTEPKASTADEFQMPHLTQIWHPEYCYFIVQENPQIATQYIGLAPAETFINYWLPLDIKDTAAVFITSGPSQQESLFQFNQPICERISETLHTIIRHTETQTYHEISDTLSTSAPPISSNDVQIEQSAINLFDAYRHEEFDTDIAYEFTNDLDTFIQANGKSAIPIINNLIKKQALDDDLISETLEALGRIEDENTKDQRYQVLIGFIKHNSPIIRDGAVSGLSFLDDKRALFQLRMLFETETVSILKNNIKVAIKGLELH